MRSRIVTPLYRGIREKFPANQTRWTGNSICRSACGGSRRNCGRSKSAKGLTIYFIDQPEFYHRAGLYQEADVSYPDNAERFIFFSKGVAHLARYLPWQPDMVHVHDWQAGLVPALMLHQQRAEGWGNPPPTCLTIHNLAYQGVFPAAAFALTNLPRNFSRRMARSFTAS